MKKIICVILIILMTFSLTSCSEKVKVEGNDIYVVAKDIGTNKITIKISGTFPEYDEINYSFTDQETIDEILSMFDQDFLDLSLEDLENEESEESTDSSTSETPLVEGPSEDENVEISEEESVLEEETEESADIEVSESDETETYDTAEAKQLINVSEIKRKKNLLIYEVTGVSKGLTSLLINFVKDGISQSYIMANVTISDSLTISDCTITLSETPEFYPLNTDSETKAYVSSLYSDSIYLRINEDEGDWYINIYDEKYLDVSMINYDYGEEYSLWGITGISESDEAIIELINEDLGSYIRLYTSVTFDDSDSRYMVSINRSLQGEYCGQLDDYQIENGNSKSSKVILTDSDGVSYESYEEVSIIENLYIPSEAIVSGLLGYSNSGSEKKEDYNSLEVTLSFNNVDCRLLVTNNSTLEEEISYIKEGLEIQSETELQLSSLNVYIYQSDAWYVLWQDNDNIYMLTILSDRDISGIEEFITDYLTV